MRPSGPFSFGMHPGRRTLSGLTERESPSFVPLLLQREGETVTMCPYCGHAGAGKKTTLTADVAALREEVPQLRQALEEARRPTPPTPLPGEGEVIEMIVEDATRIADERDDLARQLEDAKRKLAETEKPKHAGS